MCSPEVRTSPGTEVLRPHHPVYSPRDLLPPVLSSASKRRHANKHVRTDMKSLRPRLDGMHRSPVRGQRVAHSRCLRGRSCVTSPPSASLFPSLLQGRSPRRPPRSIPGLIQVPTQRSPCQTSLPGRPPPHPSVHSSCFIFLPNIAHYMTHYRWL